MRHRVSISAVWNFPYRGTGGMEAALGGGRSTAFSRPGAATRSACSTARTRRSSACGLWIRSASRRTSAAASNWEPERIRAARSDADPGRRGQLRQSADGKHRLRAVSRQHDRAQRFQRPGKWNINLGLNKRFRFGTKAVQARFEVFNLFNHANMYAHTDNADISGTTMITGFKDDYRRMQLGVKYEF